MIHGFVSCFDESGSPGHGCFFINYESVEEFVRIRKLGIGRFRNSGGQ